MSDIESLSDAIAAFADERDWGRFHDPKSLLIALMGEVGEVAELLQWLPADTSRDMVRVDPLQSRLAEELSDVLIYLLQLARVCGINLSQAAPDKIAANAVKYPVTPPRGDASHLR